MSDSLYHEAVWRTGAGEEEEEAGAGEVEGEAGAGEVEGGVMAKREGWLLHLKVLTNTTVIDNLLWVYYSSFDNKILMNEWMNEWMATSGRLKKLYFHKEII